MTQNHYNTDIFIIIQSDNFSIAFQSANKRLSTTSPLTYADRLHNVSDHELPPDRTSWSGRVSTRSDRGQTTDVSDRQQIVMRLDNLHNSCFANGVVNLMFSCPPFLRVLATSQEYLQPGCQGDVLRELQALASLPEGQVNSTQHSSPYKILMSSLVLQTDSDCWWHLHSIVMLAILPTSLATTNRTHQSFWKPSLTAWKMR